MTFHRWELLVAIFLAFTSSMSAADETFRADLFQSVVAEMEAKGRPTGLPPLDVETRTFIEPPPIGFTTEEYRAAFRQLVLDDVDRRSRDDHFQRSDRNSVRQILLEGMQRDDRPGASITEAAIEALWYLRTPPADIPPSPELPGRTPEIESLRIHQSLFPVFSWSLVIWLCVIGDRRRRSAGNR